MAAMDLFGRRWLLRLMWELRDGPLGARAILGRCDGLSSSVLYQRLTELAESGLIAKDERGHYVLTELGAGLAEALRPLDVWAKEWAAGHPSNAE